jgi:sarcosine oxidase subunit alpha
LLTSIILIRNRENTNPRPEQLRVFVNGQAVSVPGGASVAAAILQANVPFRRSVSGEPRSALCAMGICEECRATVDGMANVRTCQRIAAQGMEIVTG